MRRHQGLLWTEGELSSLSHWPLASCMVKSGTLLFVGPSIFFDCTMCTLKKYWFFNFPLYAGLDSRHCWGYWLVAVGFSKMSPTVEIENLKKKKNGQLVGLPFFPLSHLSPSLSQISDFSARFLYEAHQIEATFSYTTNNSRIHHKVAVIWSSWT